MSCVSTSIHSVADRSRPTIGMQLPDTDAIHYTGSELISELLIIHTNTCTHTWQQKRQLINRDLHFSPFAITYRQVSGRQEDSEAEAILLALCNYVACIHI